MNIPKLIKGTLFIVYKQRKLKIDISVIYHPIGDLGMLLFLNTKTFSRTLEHVEHSTKILSTLNSSPQTS